MSGSRGAVTESGDESPHSKESKWAAAAAFELLVRLGGAPTIEEPSRNLIFLPRPFHVLPGFLQNRPSYLNAFANFPPLLLEVLPCSFQVHELRL